MAATRLEVSVALRVTNAGALINALARPISYTWYVFYRLLLYLVYVFCCTDVIHGGWVDRFVGVTVVRRSAVLL